MWIDILQPVQDVFLSFPKSASQQCVSLIQSSEWLCEVTGGWGGDTICVQICLLVSSIRCLRCMCSNVHIIFHTSLGACLREEAPALVVLSLRMLNDEVKLQCSERLIDQCILGKESAAKLEHRENKTHVVASFFHFLSYGSSHVFAGLCSFLYFFFFFNKHLFRVTSETYDARRGNVLVWVSVGYDLINQYANCLS